MLFRKKQQKETCKERNMNYYVKPIPHFLSFASKKPDFLKTSAILQAFFKVFLSKFFFGHWLLLHSFLAQSLLVTIFRGMFYVYQAT